MEACLHPTGLLRRQGTRRALKSPPQSQGPRSPVKPHPQPSLPPPYGLRPPHGSETCSPLSRSLVLAIVLPLLDSLLTGLQPTPPGLIASPPPHRISGSHSSPLPWEKHGWEAQKELGDTAASPRPIDPWVLSSRRVLDVPSPPGAGVRLLHRRPLPGCSSPDPCSLLSAFRTQGFPSVPQPPPGTWPPAGELPAYVAGSAPRGPSSWAPGPPTASPSDPQEKLLSI